MISHRKMGIFKKRTTENQIVNSGRWPVRHTEFRLTEDYEFPPGNYTEVFFVKEGTLLHEIDGGNQALRRGGIIVCHPGNRHAIKNPVEVKLERLRFLPEWFASDYSTIIDSPDLFSLFFAQSWIQYPSESTLFVFSLRESWVDLIEGEMKLLHELLKSDRHHEPITRVALLKLLLLLGEEFHRYMRGGNRIVLRDEIRVALDFIERAVLSGESLRLKELEPATGMSQDHLGRLFRKATGVTLVDYAQRRRIHHAALRLLTRSDTAKDIAERLGFTDPAHFSKSFQRYFEMPPNNYRLKYGIVREELTAPAADPEVPDNDSPHSEETEVSASAWPDLLQEAVPAPVHRSFDAEETDAEETDAEETDAEETDAEKTDAEETDAEKTDAELDDDEPTGPINLGGDEDDRDQTSPIPPNTEMVGKLLGKEKAVSSRNRKKR
ncbi:MAG TPA: helix-turn-helix domain-containing protein [Verrucomicrobiales bacterium]|nr:helix-turn-helix domain-containing protein [Verrucomicrobiales bacterium]